MKRLRRAALRVALATAGLGLASGVVALEPSIAARSTAEAIERLNALRREGLACGASAREAADPVRWDDRLAAAARRQAAELAAHGRLEHRDRAGRSLATRLAAEGYPLVRAVENLAFGMPTATEAIDAWRASPAHCANLTDAVVADVGLGSAERDGTRYWVLVLAAPAAPPSRASPRHDAPLAGGM